MNALVGIEIVLGCQVKSVVFSELSDIETESLRDNIMQDAMDVLFAIAFIGGISLNFTTLSTLTVLFFLKVFHYMCDFRQESVCCPLPSCTHFFFFGCCCCTWNKPSLDVSAHVLGMDGAETTKRPTDAAGHQR